MEVLRDVLETLKTAGLTLNLGKCFFLWATIEYLGYRISASLIQPSRLKIEAVKGFIAPGDVHHVRQFMGLTWYFTCRKTAGVFTPDQEDPTTISYGSRGSLRSVREDQERKRTHLSNYRRIHQIYLVASGKKYKK
jgi:hypothetical protein